MSRPLPPYAQPSGSSSSGPRERMRTVRATIAPAILLAVGVLGGCGEADEPPGITKQAVAFDDVPASVRDAGQKAVPEVKLKEAWKNLDGEGKLHSYELRGRNPADGKIREVRVSTKGEILEKE